MWVFYSQITQAWQGPVKTSAVCYLVKSLDGDTFIF